MPYRARGAVRSLRFDRFNERKPGGPWHRARYALRLVWLESCWTRPRLIAVEHPTPREVVEFAYLALPGSVYLVRTPDPVRQDSSMKRAIAVVAVAGATIAVLVGCGGEDGEDSGSPTSAARTTTKQTTAKVAASYASAEQIFLALKAGGFPCTGYESNVSDQFKDSGQCDIDSGAPLPVGIDMATANGDPSNFTMWRGIQKARADESGGAWEAYFIEGPTWYVSCRKIPNEPVAKSACTQAQSILGGTLN